VRDPLLKVEVKKMIMRTGDDFVLQGEGIVAYECTSHSSSMITLK
jgi:hypothetical protein